MVGSQTAQRTFSLNADGRGLAVRQIDRLAVLDALSCNAEFCCQHNLITNGRKSFAQQFFIGFTIHNGGIKEGAPQIHGMAKQSDHLAPWGGPAVGMVHAHAAKPDFRNEQVVSQLTLFHV